jgi:hypothetical protein
MRDVQGISCALWPPGSYLDSLLFRPENGVRLLGLLVLDTTLAGKE